MTAMASFVVVAVPWARQAAPHDSQQHAPSSSSSSSQAARLAASSAQRRRVRGVRRTVRSVRAERATQGEVTDGDAAAHVNDGDAVHGGTSGTTTTTAAAGRSVVAGVLDENDFRSTLDRNWASMRGFLDDDDDFDDDDDDDNDGDGGGDGGGGRAAAAPGGGADDFDAAASSNDTETVAATSTPAAAAPAAPQTTTTPGELPAGAADPAELFDSDGTPEWYFLQARAGMEERVRNSLESMMRSLPAFGRKVADVLVPKLQVMKLNSYGRTVRKEDRMFPGYLLVFMVMDYPTWREVNGVPYVQGFVGDTNQKDFKGPFQKPLPVAQAEIRQIFHRLHESADEEAAEHSRFQPGQRVVVTDGAFAEHEGRVVKVIPEQRLASVSIFKHNRVTEEEFFFPQLSVVEDEHDSGEHGGGEGEGERVRMPSDVSEMLARGGADGRAEVNVKKMRRRNRAYKKGDHVVVTRGPYGGCSGTVKTTLPRQQRAIVALRMFSRSLETKLDLELLRPDDDDKRGGGGEDDSGAEAEAMEGGDGGFTEIERQPEEDEDVSDAEVDAMLFEHGNGDGAADSDDLAARIGRLFGAGGDSREDGRESGAATATDAGDEFPDAELDAQLFDEDGGAERGGDAAGAADNSDDDDSFLQSIRDSLAKSASSTRRAGGRGSKRAAAAAAAEAAPRGDGDSVRSVFGDDHDDIGDADVSVDRIEDDDAAGAADDGGEIFSVLGRDNDVDEASEPEEDFAWAADAPAGETSASGAEIAEAAADLKLDDSDTHVEPRRPRGGESRAARAAAKETAPAPPEAGGGVAADGDMLSWLYDDDEGDSGLSLQTPKKRAKPRSRRLFGADDDDGGDSGVELPGSKPSPPADAAAPTAKRKSGRAKKAASAATDEPKQVDAKLPPPTNSKSDEEKPAAAGVTADTKPAPKKRGRPRKKPVE